MTDLQAAEQLKVHLYCPNEECGVDPGGMARGFLHRAVKRWTFRPEIEATDDPVIHMTFPRENLFCPDCGTRGYCR